MAFAITNLVTPQDASFVSSPSFTVQQADVAVGAATTTNGTSVATAPNAKTFRAMVYLKTVAGASTIEVKLQISDVTGFTGTNTFTIDQWTVNVATATGANFGGYYIQMFGESPLFAGAAGFMRVSYVTGSGTSGTADVILESA